MSKEKAAAMKLMMDDLNPEDSKNYSDYDHDREDGGHLRTAENNDDDSHADSDADSNEAAPLSAATFLLPWAKEPKEGDVFYQQVDWPLIIKLPFQGGVRGKWEVKATKRKRFLKVQFLGNTRERGTPVMPGGREYAVYALTPLKATGPIPIEANYWKKTIHFEVQPTHA